MFKIKKYLCVLAGVVSLLGMVEGSTDMESAFDGGFAWNEDIPREVRRAFRGCESWSQEKWNDGWNIFYKALGYPGKVRAHLKGNDKCIGEDFQIQMAKVLLDSGAHLRTYNDAGRTPLMNACKWGHLPIVEALIGYKDADVNRACKYGSTALMYASDGGHVDIVRLLLEAGADVNLADKYGKTALNVAVTNEDVELVRVIMQHGGDVRLVNMYLIRAVKLRNWEMVKEFLGGGADVAKAFYKDVPALVYAAEEGNVEAVRMLLAAGVDANAVDPDGKTALMHVAENGGDLEMLGVLLDGGATNRWVEMALRIQDMESKEEILQSILAAAVSSGADKGVAFGWTEVALHISNMESTDEIVELLLEAAVNENSADVMKEKLLNSDLIKATGDRDWEKVEALLEQGGEVGNAIYEKVPALIYAVVEENSSAVKMLLEAGADVGATDLRRNSALSIAAKVQNVDVIRALLRGGANLSESTDIEREVVLILAMNQLNRKVLNLLLDGDKFEGAGYGWRAPYTRNEPVLFLASEHGHVEVVRMLLREGVDVNIITNYRGDTALALASENGHVEVVKMLLEAGANVNEPTGYWGYTALALAQTRGHQQIVDLLLAAGGEY